jgi:thiosulfate reductase cytochrome b subunit
MNDSAGVRNPSLAPRHPAIVRLTHWLTTLAFFALLLSGVEIVISHPRFYWGETGNVNMPPLLTLPIPASRALVPTGYGFVLPDQNGWSRSLHFQSAWLIVFTGLFYLAYGFITRHFRNELLPRSSQPDADGGLSYNPLQRLTYLAIIFLVFPCMIWTGLAMSPAVTAAFPFLVTSLGGQQSARTLHFLGTSFLLSFLVVHVTMVWRAGFSGRTRAMITGFAAKKERP